MPVSSLASKIGATIVRQLSRTPNVLAAEAGLKKVPVTGSTGERGAKPSRSSVVQSIHSQTNDQKSRQDAYTLYRQMCKNIPEANKCLGIITDFVFGGTGAQVGADWKSFEVVFSPSCNPATKQAVEDAIVDLKLPKYTVEATKSALKHGDCFNECVYNLTDMIALKPLVPDDTSVVWDELCQVERYVVKDADSGKEYSLHPFQVVHIAPNQSLGSKYGESIFYALKNTSIQYQSAISVLFVLLLIQSAHRRTVTTEVPSHWAPEQIAEYVDALREWNEDVPFFNKDGELLDQIVQLLDFDDQVYPYKKGFERPNITQEQQADFGPILSVLQWMQDRIFMGTGVPKALAGIAKDTNSRATLEQQGLHFVKSLRVVQMWTARFLVEVLLRVVIVKGLPIKPDDFMIRMPHLSEFNDRVRAEVSAFRARAALSLSQAGLPMRFVLSNILEVPDDKIEDILAEVEEPEVPIQPGERPDTVDDPMTDEDRLEAVMSQFKDQIDGLKEDVMTLLPVVVSPLDM